MEVDEEGASARVGTTATNSVQTSLHSITFIVTVSQSSDTILTAANNPKKSTESAPWLRTAVWATVMR